jgi:hypothetical protein
MQTRQFWGAHAAGVLHSATVLMFPVKVNSNLVGGRFDVNLRFVL